MVANWRCVLTAAVLLSAASLGGAGPAAGLDAGSGWSPRAVLSSTGGWPVDVTVAANGAMSAAWAHGGHVELARRGPGGAWGAPTTVVNRGGTPRLASDRHGTLYLAWTVPGRVWKLKEKHTTSGGHWSPAVTVMRRQAPAALVDYDVAADGAALVAVHAPNGVVVKRRSAAGAWSAPTRWANVVDIDEDLGGHGLAAAVLTLFFPSAAQPEVGLRVVEVTRQRPGGSWSRPVVLQRQRNQRLDPSWPGQPGITVDPAGTTTVAWYGSDANHPREGVATSRAHLGGGWSSPRVVIPRMGSEHRILAMTSDDGSVLVVAVRNYSRVLTALRPARAPWRDPTTVAPQGRWISGWDAARDPNGGAVVAWTRCQGPGFLCDGVWGRIMSPDGTWGPQARLGGPQVPDGESTWAAMGHGEALVVWSGVDQTGPGPLLARTH
jgi:hypothetical protein